MADEWRAKFLESSDGRLSAGGGASDDWRSRFLATSGGRLQAAAPEQIPVQSTPVPVSGLQMRAANGAPVMLSDIESAPPGPQGNFPQRVSQTIGNWFVHDPVGRTAAEVATPIVQAETLGAANVGDVPQALPPPQSVAEAISRQGAKAATNLALMTNVIPNPGGAVAKGVGALTGGGIPGYAIGLPAFTSVNEALDPNQTVYEKVRSAVQSPVSMPVEAIRAPINAYRAATAEPPINPPTMAERVYQTGEALQPAVLAALPFIIQRAAKQAAAESPPRPGASSAEVTRSAPPPDLLPFQTRPPIAGKPIPGATFEPTVTPQPAARVAPAPISEVPGVPTTINEAIAKAMSQEIANAKEAGIRAQEASSQEGVIGGESGRLRLRDDAQNRLEAQAGDEGRLRGVREPAQPVPPAEEVVSGAAAEPAARNTILEQIKSKPDDYYYHGTPIDAAYGIEKSGIEAGTLAGSKGLAADYGDVIAVFRKSDGPKPVGQKPVGVFTREELGAEPAYAASETGAFAEPSAQARPAAALPADVARAAPNTETKPTKFQQLVPDMTPGESVDSYMLRTSGEAGRFLRNPQRVEGKLYRGMSRAELKSAIKSNAIQSKGYGSFSTQKGETHFTDYPASATSYATGFAMRGWKPRENRPAYVVEVNRGSQFKENAVGEFYSDAPTPMSEVTRVWEITPKGSESDIKGSFAGYTYKDVTDQFVKQSMPLPAEQARAAPTKQPWEMTRDELADAVRVGNKQELETARPLLAELFKDELKDWNRGNDPWNIARAVNIGDEAPRVPMVDFTKRHRAIVQNAIAEGRPVPPEVLADYPDFKPTPAPGAADAPIVKEAPGASETPAETPRESVGLTKADQNQMREAFDLPKLEQAKRKGWEKSVAGAKEKGLDAKAIEIAEEVQRDPRMLNDEERAAITLKATELNNDIPASQKLVAELTAKGDMAAAKVEQARADALLEQLDTVTKAGRYAGSEVGRALNSIKVRFFKDNYELAPVLQRARESRGRELSPDEQRAFTELVAKHEAVVKERDALQATHDKYVLDTNAKLAERELQRQSRRGQIEKGTAERRERLFKERTEIKKRIAALGYQVNVGVPPELAIEVGKLAVNYWKEGVGTISDVAKKVVADMPSLNELDVYGAILAREPRRQAKAMSEATRRVSDLKKQAALMLEAEGLDPAKIAELRKNSYKAIDNPTKLERVLEKIDELQKHLKAGTRPEKKARAGEPDTPAIKAAKEQLADIRREMRVEDDIAKLQAQIASGDIPVRQRPEQRIRNRHLEEKEIALRKARHAIETKISEGKKRGVLGIIGEVAEVPKATQASGDVSATLMQGLLLGARHPIDASRAFVNAMGDMFSPERAERTYQQIVSDPRHYLAEKAGLRFNEPAPLPGEGQEMFASKVINAIPVLGSVVRGSNRHMTTHLNLLRHYAFNRFLDANPNAPMSELKGLANVLNVFSGYGDIGANPGAEKWLRRIFRAPRLAAARLQTPWMLAKHWSEPRVRGEIIKTFGSAAAIGTSIMSMAAMTGAKVGMDPDKGDFGKISYGAKHYDIFPGFTALARLVAIGGKRLAERVHLIKKGKGEVDLFDQAARNAIYKLNPVLSLGKELITGKDVFGKKVGVGEAFSHLLPFSIQTGIEATKVEGAKSIAQTAIPAAFGVGVSTYNDKKKRQ